MSLTIEADNYDDVIKKARAEKRRAAQQEKIDKTDRDMAYLKAHAALGHIAERLLDETALCQYWDAGVRKLKRINNDHCTLQLEDEHGPGEVHFFEGAYPVKMLLDGAGWILAVMVQEQQSSEWYAVGVQKGKAALVKIPNLLAFRVEAYLAAKALEATQSTQSA